MEITVYYPKSAAEVVFLGTRNAFEIAVIMNEPSVFEPLKFYCTSFLFSGVSNSRKELKRAIRVQENIILCLEEDLQFSRSFCQPHAIEFFGDQY